MKFKAIREFKKDYKKLTQKYKSLDGDLFEFKKILKKVALGIGKHFVVLTKVDNIHIVKARFFCQTLKGKSLRIVYAYHERDGEIEFFGVEFIEMFYKGDKEGEDKKRIKKYLSEGS